MHTPVWGLIWGLVSLLSFAVTITGLAVSARNMRSHRTGRLLVLGFGLQVPSGASHLLTNWIHPGSNHVWMVYPVVAVLSISGWALVVLSLAKLLREVGSRRKEPLARDFCKNCGEPIGMISPHTWKTSWVLQVIPSLLAVQRYCQQADG
jgi:hypothetical protein